MSATKTKRLLAELFTVKQIIGMPKLYDQEALGDDAVVYAHLFGPLSGWDWYITEADFDKYLAFGLVRGCDVEVGYIDLAELLNAELTARVECDRSWRPRKLRDVKALYQERAVLDDGPSCNKCQLESYCGCLAVDPCRDYSPRAC